MKQTPIQFLHKDDALTAMYDICAKIYIARNISYDSQTILDCLTKIDSLFQTIEYSGDIERSLQILDGAALEVGFVND